jgi:MIP family channel proteins
MDKNLRGYLAELFGTFAVVFLSAGAVCVNQVAIITDHPDLRLGVIGIALAYGLAYAAALAATQHLSSGYLNPAITLMLWVFKRLDGAKTAALIFVQLLGAAMAGGVLRLVYNNLVLGNARFGTPHLNLQAFDVSGITAAVLLKGVLIECCLTFILTFVIYGTIIDPRATRLLGTWGKRLLGVWVGLALVAMTLAAYAYTGASVNPARWFGPWIWEGTVPQLQTRVPDHVVYWFGPIAGALLAGVVYNLLILPAEEEHAAAATTTGSKVAAGAGATLFRSKK